MPLACAGRRPPAYRYPSLKVGTIMVVMLALIELIDRVLELTLLEIAPPFIGRRAFLVFSFAQRELPLRERR